MASLKALNEKAIAMGLVGVRKSLCRDHGGYEIVTTNRLSGYLGVMPDKNECFWVKTLKNVETNLDHLIVKRGDQWVNLYPEMESDERKIEEGMTRVDGVWYWND